MFEALEPPRDAFHTEVLERVSAWDRRFADEHPDAGFVIRPAVPHELCVAGERCTVATWIKVTFFVEPGVRMRQAWSSPWAR